MGRFWTSVATAIELAIEWPSSPTAALAEAQRKLCLKGVQEGGSRTVTERRGSRKKSLPGIGAMLEVRPPQIPLGW